MRSYSSIFRPTKGIEWGWVDYVLKEFNFGENFRGWIKMLFNGA
jgi:hypothetical protein